MTAEERLAAVLALHSPRRGVDTDGEPFTYGMCGECDEWYPCPTARAAGVTDDQAGAQDGRVEA